MIPRDSIETILDYYTQPGFMTDPGEYKAQFQQLPQDLPALVQVVQGLLLHVFWAERYGVTLSEQRQGEVQIRPVRAMLDRLMEIDHRPLSEARPLEQRLVGNCRHFSTLLAAILKQQGIPARARCGFGTYFLPDHYEDHWITEYWNAQRDQWVQVDAQLDDLQREVLNIRFNTLDMPAGQFVTGGTAWRMCRAGKANPDDFGIFDMHGWDFIKNDLLLDVRALNRLELLPWDVCGLAAVPYEQLTVQQFALLDQAAALSDCAGLHNFSELRALYESEEGFHVPSEMLR